MSQAKKRIKDLIVAEQAEKTITDEYISRLSQDDMDQLKALQRKLTVSIRLDKGLEDQEPKIHLEGLTRDVFTAESTIRSVTEEKNYVIKLQSRVPNVGIFLYICLLLTIRDIIRRVERTENLKRKALLLSGLVEWQFQHRNGMMVPFDMYTNLHLEEALEKKQSMKIKINNETYNTDVTLRKAVSANGLKVVELLRKEMKGE